MRFTRIYLLLVCSALIPACAIPIPGDAPWSDLHANAYAAGFAPSLEMSASNIVIPGINDGDDPKLVGSFNVDAEREYTSSYGARIGFAPYELSVSHFSYFRDQNGEVEADGYFGGNPVSGVIDVNSTLDIAATKIMLGVDVINTPVARVGLLFGVDIFSFNQFRFTAIDTALGYQDVLVDQEVPVPIIGVRADVAIPGTDIRLGAEVTGVAIDISGVEASFFDHEINVNMEIFENAEAVVGYRVVDLNIDGDIDGTTINMDLSMSGPYFGVSVYF